MKAKYSIVNKDMYNFDKSSFLIGKILSQLVVTGLEKPRKRKKLQPSNCEWVTLVQGVSATGKRILLFLIFASKVLISNWFNNLLRDWVI
jgi:hypothetical protein